MLDFSNKSNIFGLLNRHNKVTLQLNGSHKNRNSCICKIKKIFSLRLTK